MADGLVALSIFLVVVALVAYLTTLVIRVLMRTSDRLVDTHYRRQSKQPKKVYDVSRYTRAPQY